MRHSKSLELSAVFAVVFMLAWAAPTSGQVSTLPCSANCQLARGQAFSVVYNWAPTALNPDAADGFRLYQNGVVKSEVGASALQNGTVSFPFASGLTTTGTYTFNVAAFTTTGGENLGDPITVTIIKGKPAKPTNGRVQ